MLLILGLIPELGLTVDGPAQEPAGILHGHDAAGNHAAGKGVALADILDIGNPVQKNHLSSFQVFTCLRRKRIPGKLHMLRLLLVLSLFHSILLTF